MANHDDQILARFKRSVDVGEYLYKQGDMGNTMFVLTSGTVHLYRKTHGIDRLVGTIGPGEMLGEKAILRKGAYQRSLTAQAKTAVDLLEFDAANLKVIQSKLPDFSMSIVRVLSDRLDEANELISILHSPDEVERVVEYLVFATRHHSLRLPAGGNQIFIVAADISHAINAPKAHVEEILRDLVQKKALLPKPDGFIVPDQALLEEQIGDLKAKQAA